ncbi:MAG: cobaltochelatase subunit CobN [Chitinophagaceae bacterium]|nr:cobaltochelatase subunit CobN [Chitinophagaceae bacterium]
MKKKKILLVGVSVLLFVLAWLFWYYAVAPTKIALYNFSANKVSNIALSNKDRFIRYIRVPSGEISRLKDADFILGSAMGLKINPEQRAELIKISKKVPTHFTMVFNPENNISTVSDKDLGELEKYLDNGSRENYQNMGRYVRKYMDKKWLFAGEPGDPVPGKREVYFHYDEKIAFEHIADFENYVREKKLYKEGAPRVAIIAGIHDPYSGDKQFIDSAISAFYKAGFNVYPVASSLDRIHFLEEIQPDAVVYFPHGRLLVSAPDQAVDWLKKHNVPFFTPLTVTQLEDEWRNDRMGMPGAFMGQTITLPELDGALYPYVIFAQHHNKDGLFVTKAIPERLENLTQIVGNYIRLKQTENKNKKIALYFFRNEGENATVGQGLEVTASLYNVLRRLKHEGYTVNDLPATEKELGDLLAKRATVFDPDAHGAFERFVEEGNPILVEAAEYHTWLKKALSDETYRAVVKQYGEDPGEYMTVEKDGKKYIAIAGVQLGNVYLLAQPLAALGEEGFKMTHGVKVAPPHPYLAAYLWMQYGLKADALIHFGTHGSLEFTPDKQVALTRNDWPELLVGNIPHLYYYTIGNIGESMMAKRRTYAATISYLTPPFAESGMRKEFSNLQDAIRGYYKASDEEKKVYAMTVKKMAVKMGIHRSLQLDSTLAEPYSEDEIERIDNFAEEIATEKINGELYTSGVPYTSEKIRSTVLAMSADPIAYSIAALDKQRGKVTDQQLKRNTFFTETYLNPAKTLVNRVLDGQPADEKLVLSVAGITHGQLEEARQALTPPQMPSFIVTKKSESEKNKFGVPDFVREKLLEEGYDVNKDVIPESVIEDFREMWKKIPGFVQKRIVKKYGTQEAIEASVRRSSEANRLSIENKKDTAVHKQAEGKPKKKTTFTKEEIELARAVSDIERTLTNINKYKKALMESPELEMKALINGLNGGYTAPSSGGDAVANPNAVPSGHNMYSINAENTPSETAWDVGKKLAQNTIDEYRKKHGDYPKKVAYTFWSSEFIETNGVSIAQVLYMLGAEPVWDNFGRVDDVRLIPSGELKRPRIDIVIQTSGQFRDLASSRMFLIAKAIDMAANAKDEGYGNSVKEGSVAIETALVKKGVSPKDAREWSTRRIFGGLENAYGTGIQEYVKAGDQWETGADIAAVYMHNMGASYDSDKDWADFREDLFRAALQNTEVLIHPRQNNTWGALTLDHVYEFMGGLNTSVKQVTGKDPDAYLADYRNHRNMRMQELKEAVGVEARATLFNPNYIQEMMKGREGAATQVADITTNMYGWNATRAGVIDQEMWDELYDTYIADKYKLHVQDFFMAQNPAALQTTTAVMLETARKGMWKATDDRLKTLATLHSDLSNRIGAESSNFALNNDKLQDFIAHHLSDEKSQAFKAGIRKAKENRNVSIETKDAQVLEKQELTPHQEKETVHSETGWIIGGVLAVFVGLVVLLNRRRKRNV